MPILNYYAEGFISYPQMRAMCVHWSNGIIREPHNLGSPTYNDARTAGEDVYKRQIWFSSTERSDKVISPSEVYLAALLIRLSSMMVIMSAS